jgi:hypothetical protein
MWRAGGMKGAAPHPEGEPPARTITMTDGIRQERPA